MSQNLRRECGESSVMALGAPRRTHVWRNKSPMEEWLRPSA